jgi:hypothetical protein
MDFPRNFKQKQPNYVKTSFRKVDYKKRVPFWYQKKYMKNLSRFRLNLGRVLLNRDILLKAEKFKSRYLEKRIKSLENNHFDKDTILLEQQWKKQLDIFFKDLLEVCNTISPFLDIYIFGGIINKIINHTFTIQDHDIDMYITYRSRQVPPNMLIRILEELKTRETITELIDTDTFSSQFVHQYSGSYRYLINRPGITGLKHLKGKRLFKKIGYIDIDILSGSPNEIGVDCNISNLQYNLRNKSITSMKFVNQTILSTLIDIRHKRGTLFLPIKYQGQGHLQQMFLLQSRQKKYLMQNWNLFNRFSLPEVEDNWECAICYTSTKNTEKSESIITFECSHSFCKKCLISMLNTEACPCKDVCPYCRKPIKVKYNIVNEDSWSFNNIINSPWNLNHIHPVQDNINSSSDDSDDSSDSGLSFT